MFLIYFTYTTMAQLTMNNKRDHNDTVWDVLELGKQFQEIKNKDIAGKMNEEISWQPSWISSETWFSGTVMEALQICESKIEKLEENIQQHIHKHNRKELKTENNDSVIVSNDDRLENINLPKYLQSDFRNLHYIVSSFTKAIDEVFLKSGWFWVSRKRKKNNNARKAGKI